MLNGDFSYGIIYLVVDCFGVEFTVWSKIVVSKFLTLCQSKLFPVFTTTKLKFVEFLVNFSLKERILKSPK